MADLSSYLARIGYAGDLTPGPTLLVELHQAHASRIPFENLDILLGRPIQVDLDSIQTKLIHRRRGGYCFERYSLFNLDFSIDRGAGPETRTLADPLELLQVLEETFGLVFPPGTRFRFDLCQPI